MTLIAPSSGNGDKLVNSAILTIVARFAMITAAGAMPVGGWMLQRSISTVDEIARRIESVRDQGIETGITVKLIQQTLQLQTAIINDHESRMRNLEGRIGPQKGR